MKSSWIRLVPSISQVSLLPQKVKTDLPNKINKIMSIEIVKIEKFNHLSLFEEVRGFTEIWWRSMP